jgi:hypothetical protein
MKNESLSRVKGEGRFKYETVGWFSLPRCFVLQRLGTTLPLLLSQTASTHHHLTPSLTIRKRMNPLEPSQAAAHSDKSLKHKRRYCRAAGCTKIVKSQGLCQRHGAKPKKCKVETCGKQAQGNFGGMCSKYERVLSINLLAAFTSKWSPLEL